MVFPFFNFKNLQQRPLRKPEKIHRSATPAL